MSDNGSQLSAQGSAEFANIYGFKHVKSSLKYPQNKDQMERMVQTKKNLLKNAGDPHLAVLSYHVTPHYWCKLSPAELSMEQQIHTLAPVIDDQLFPFGHIFQDTRRSISSSRKTKRMLLTTSTEFIAYHLFPMIRMYGLKGQMLGKVVSTAQSLRSYIWYSSWLSLQKQVDILISKNQALQIFYLV